MIVEIREHDLGYTVCLNGKLWEITPSEIIYLKPVDANKVFTRWFRGLCLAKTVPVHVVQAIVEILTKEK